MNVIPLFILYPIQQIYSDERKIFAGMYPLWVVVDPYFEDKCILRLYFEIIHYVPESSMSLSADGQVSLVVNC